MNEMVEVAVGEIARVAAWSLRGLGMAFGVADRAASLVGWAEAVEGGALARLRAITPLLDAPRRGDWHSRQSEMTWRFDASGRSLLEVGPVAVDLLTLAARTRQLGRVDIVNVADPVFLSGVMRLAAKRKIGLVALPAGGQLSLCGAAVASLHAFAGLDGPLFDEAIVVPNDAVAGAIAACRAQLVHSDPGLTTISLLSYGAADVPERLARVPAQFDAEGKYTLAQSHGVRVERRDLAHLYELEVRTWAPTSDRSRSQALA